MTEQPTTSLMDATRWAGQVFSGRWRESHGGTSDVREPATGRVLGAVEAFTETQ